MKATRAWENENGTKSTLPPYGHAGRYSGGMTMVLMLVLICLVGSALLGFRGYWS